MLTDRLNSDVGSHHRRGTDRKTSKGAHVDRNSGGGDDTHIHGQEICSQDVRYTCEI